MAKGQGTSRLIVTIVILALTLAIVGGIAIAQNAQKAADTTAPAPAEEATDTPAPATEEETPPVEEPEEPAIDKSKVSEVDIKPMSITVSYMKGLPGFQFAIQRTDEGTQYVEFSAPELKSTKCTDDDGLFASIIKNPTSVEDKATLAKTTTVGDDTYGLSLAGKNCTGDTDLLEQYQEAFVKPFGLLKEDK